MKILNVVGARPNFMKIAPLIREMRIHGGIEQSLVHTGQHYDANLSDVFFRDLDIPEPDFNLAVGPGTRDEQIVRIGDAFERVVLREHPDLVLVVGDVNSTIACGQVAKAHRIAIAHVEAGLRSFDPGMPEELNRVATDRISDYLFVTEESGLLNLANESIEGQRYLVGNVMIDTLIHTLPAAERSTVLKDLGVSAHGYMLATFHRPSNVDDRGDLVRLIDTIRCVCKKSILVLPLHPRTQKSLATHALMATLEATENLVLAEPFGYVDFLRLASKAKAIITDSGGIQEETTYLGVPCLTMRSNTERPVTVTHGTNTLVGSDRARLLFEIDAILGGRYKRGDIPPLWDGHAARRIVDILEREMRPSNDHRPVTVL